MFTKYKNKASTVYNVEKVRVCEKVVCLFGGFLTEWKEVWGGGKEDQISCILTFDLLLITSDKKVPPLS